MKPLAPLLVLLAVTNSEAATPNVLVNLPALDVEARLEATVSLIPMRTAAPTAALHLKLPTDSTGCVTFTNVPAGRYRLHAAQSGIGDLLIIVPDTSGTVLAENIIDPAENWTAPAPAPARAINPRGVPVLWPSTNGLPGQSLRDDGTGALYWATVEEDGGTPLFETDPPGDESYVSINYVGDGDITGLTINTVDAHADFNIQDATGLLALSFPLLETMSATTDMNIIDSPDLVNLSAPVLVDGGSGVFVSNGGLTNFTLPSLETIGTINAQQCDDLLRVSMPLLETATLIFLDQNASLTNVSLPAMTTGQLLCTDSGIVSLTLTAWLPTDGQDQNLSGNALSAAAVNHVLARCVASAGYTDGTVNLSGGTSAAPTGQGAADKTTLEGRGVVVTVNP